MMATTEPKFTNPRAIAEAGERIYREKYQKLYEQAHAEKFVAINVGTEKAFVGDTPDDALETARTDDQNGVFHLMRVGYPSAFQISYATPKANTDWLFR